VAEGDGVWREYVGDVNDWMTQSSRAKSMLSTPEVPRASEPAKTPAVAESAVTDESTTTRRRKLSYKEQREFDALPQRIAELEAEQALVDKELDGGQLYATDPARATQLAARHAEIEEEWMAAMERWEELGGI